MLVKFYHTFSTFSIILRSIPAFCTPFQYVLYLLLSFSEYSQKFAFSCLSNLMRLLGNDMQRCTIITALDTQEAYYCIRRLVRRIHFTIVCVTKLINEKSGYNATF